MSRQMVRMNELIDEITMGPFGSDITVDNFIDDGVPVLNGCNVSGIKLIEESFKYVSEEKAIALKKANTKRGDIVITHRGTLGQISYIPNDSKYDNYIISQSQFRVTLKKEKIDPIYFTYYFHTSEGQKRLLSFKNHVGVPALAQATTNFRLLEFPVKPLPEQKAIAKVLSDLDAKIELNNKINAELEAMAKLIYDYWFVQFEFPANLQDPTLSGAEGYKSSGGKMVYNEELKREIPEGWEVKQIKEELEVQYGFPFSTKLFNEEGSGYPVVRIRDILNNTISIYSIEKAENKYQLEKGDLLIGMDGNFHMNFWDKNDCYLNQRCVRIRKNINSRVSLFQALFSSKPYIQAREKNVSRTTVGHLSAKDIDSLYVLVPNSSLLVTKSKVFDNLLDKLITNRNQNQQLASLRDWLLPMLMNGQVTVKEAEKKVEKLYNQAENHSMAAEPKVYYGK